MEIIEINDNLLAALHLQATASERKRMNYDLRTTAEDNSQRMLNALEVGTKVPIHRHLETSEITVCLQGCMDAWMWCFMTCVQTRTVAVLLWGTAER